MVEEKTLEEEPSEQEAERKRLQKIHGDVWNLQEVQESFTIHGFGAPFVAVTRKSDGIKGSLEFQHMPRFYFNFKEL
jgi:hypothetical protein